MEKYEEEVCKHCGQSITYLATIDQGTVDILRAISVAIYRKGINAVHPRKEMEVTLAPSANYRDMIKEGHLTSNQVGNLSKPRFHGLIAAIDGEAGNYCMTKKGAHFLRGGIIPKHAIISKVHKCNVGYYKPDEETVAVSEFSKGEFNYWEGINFDIVEGRIIKNLPIKKEEYKEKTGKLI